MVLPNNSDVVCEVCGGKKPVRVTHKRGCQIWFCGDCALFFVWPPPSLDILRSMYTNAAGCYTTTAKDLSVTSPEVAKHLHSLLMSLDVHPGRFLECGCATGHLMYHMERLGWKTQGIDINPDSIRTAKNNRLEVLCGDLLDGYFANEEFDVVFMGDTIEHLVSPKNTCKEVFRVLRPGGVFIVNTPNCLCGYSQLSLRLSQLTGLSWLYCLAPYHVFEFSPTSLNTLLKNCGFNIERLIYVKRIPHFLRLVGDTGLVDDIKLSMKKEGKYRANLHLVTSLPRLASVTCLVLPLYFGSILYDKYCKVERGITAIARKPWRSENHQRDESCKYGTQDKV